MSLRKLELDVEKFIAATPDQRRQAFRELAGGLREAVNYGRCKEAAEVLRQAILPTADFNCLQSLYKTYRALQEKGALPKARVKLAILGSVTTQQLREFIELYLYAGGLVAEVYEAGYGLFRQEILDDQSGLYRSGAMMAFLATSWRDLSRRPELSDDAGKVAGLVEAELADWRQLWDRMHRNLGCQIIQNNFEQPAWRLLGNHEMRHPSGLARFISLVNQALQDEAPSFVAIHDVDHLAGCIGRRQWEDPRIYHYGKLPCRLESIPAYAHSVASVILACRGATRKCLVLDLDNTLWGGIIGDDGLEGIQLGQGTPRGEAYVAFQRYLKGLAQRGVILAVASKNEERIAKEVFLKHPEMVLRLDDIACFQANWRDKPANLKAIAETLNIGIDSLVLADDNPAERSIVRQMVPEVAVPELPEDPAGFIEAIERHRYFQVASLGTEDLQRTEFYRANVARDEAMTASGSVEDFLRSLNMKAAVRPVCKLNFERSVQLINKTNQFNLTTRRYSAAEVLSKLEDPSWITWTVSLSDRFGDNGLISVLLARAEGNDLRVDTWVMSCRVFKRGVEQFLMNRVMAAARRRGLGRIRGEFIPTAKNGVVRELYASLGFTPLSASADGRSSWELSVSGTDRPQWQASIEEVACSD